MSMTKAELFSKTIKAAERLKKQSLLPFLLIISINWMRN